MIQIMARHFSKLLFSGELSVLNLHACISGVWWTIAKCKACAFKLRI